MVDFLELLYGVSLLRNSEDKPRWMHGMWAFSVKSYYSLINGMEDWGSHSWQSSFGSSKFQQRWHSLFGQMPWIASLLIMIIWWREGFRLTSRCGLCCREEENVSHFLSTSMGFGLGEKEINVHLKILILEYTSSKRPYCILLIFSIKNLFVIPLLLLKLSYDKDCTIICQAVYLNLLSRVSLVKFP